MSAAPAGRGGRSLAPREHGAYGQLALPLLVALAAPPRVATWLLAGGAVAAFLAHEPVLVLLGQRGERAKTADGARARGRLGGLVLAATGLGAAGLALAPADARIAAVLPAVLCAAVGVVVLRRAERTPFGQQLAAAALASLSLPVSIASGVAWRVATTEWVAWTLALSAGIAAVRAVIAAHKKKPEPSALVTVIVTGVATIGGSLYDARLAAALPLTIASAAVLVLSPHPRALRTVGWSLAASTVLVGAGLVALRAAL